MTSNTQIPIPDEISPAVPTFAEIGLHPSILQAVADTGYTIPTPIQAQALPSVMAGNDVMGAAQTGTGKTAAFTLPILHRLMPMANTSASPARHPVRALILTPTRELADQVYESVKRYGLKTPLRSTVVFGGVDIGPQKEALRNGCEVLIATPGRLLDHVEQRTQSEPSGYFGVGRGRPDVGYGLFARSRSHYAYAARRTTDASVFSDLQQ